VVAEGTVKKKSGIKVSDNLVPVDYAQFVERVKKDILQTQLVAAQSITQELILLYWRIGKAIAEKTTSEKWNTKILETFARDLANNFPGMAGFSLRNLKYMRIFAEAYPDETVATAVARIPWGHNIVLLEKLQDDAQRLWYAQKTVENGWSRSMLLMWIESDLYKRQGKAITNFKATLPQPHSDLAHETLKDPYNFDFLTIDEKAREQEVEQGLMAHIQKFLLELGQGFSFIGRQYHILAGAKDLYIDMLFYHIRLRCFIVVELKTTEFDARDLGQTNLYLAAVDNTLRHPGDAPTIGLLLCKSKDDVMAEWALTGMSKPIGIANYTTKLVETLPKKFKGQLPTIAEIEAELNKPDVVSKATKISKKKMAKKPVKKK
jgi:predicted nuclease of restriction endonuclease-like (RecB) superfamily